MQSAEFKLNGGFLIHLDLTHRRLDLQTKAARTVLGKLSLLQINVFDKRSALHIPGRDCTVLPVSQIPQQFNVFPMHWPKGQDASMRYFGRWPIACGAALLLVCGCAAGQSAGPSVAGSDHPERMIEVQLVADKASPWGRTRTTAANDGEEVDQAASATGPSQSWLSGIFSKKTPEKPAVHTKNTMMVP